MRLSSSLVLLVTACGPGLLAQPAPPHVSPEVRKDRSVVFRVSAQGAREVELDGPLRDLVIRTRRSGALWEIVTSPATPDIYEYAFRVDGVRVLDAQNPWLKFWRSASNLVEVPGDEPTAWADREVPHGAIHELRYVSRSLGGVPRRLHVYTPPGYDEIRPGEEARAYPTLYLFHGFGDDDSVWTDLGRAHLTLDNAIADGRAEPMLVVMPYGHARRAGESVPTDRRAQGISNARAVSDDVLEDVIPLIESRYRVRREASGRAAVGLSMGGGQALDLGLRHADRFAWVGAFSAAVYAPSDDDGGLEKAFPELASDPIAFTGKNALLWIACGREDFLFRTDERLSAWLSERHIPHRFLVTEGGHSWSLWRNDYLPHIVPLLFREGSRLRRERLYDGLDTSAWLGEPRTVCELAHAKAFTEGPAALPGGDVLFTDIPASRILRWSATQGRLETVRRDSNAANGLLLGRDGRLLICEGGAGRVTRLDLESGSLDVLADTFGGFPLAAPNDICESRDGRLWFSSRPGGQDPAKGNVNAVYRLDPDGTLIQALAWPRVHMPNGVALSPDERTLYLIEAHPDAGHHRDIRAFDIAPDGSLSGERVVFDFYPGRGGDGMAIDELGNLYVAAGLHATRRTSETLETRPGIHVISPEGRLLAFRETPGDTVTNCAFGGVDGRTLFVTCGRRVLAIPCRHRGARR